MNATITNICQQAGLQLYNAVPVSGGDINHAYRLDTTGGTFFLKINDAVKYPNMFDKEAAGLNQLRQAAGLYLPKVFATGLLGNQQYLLLEWLNKGATGEGFWNNFAAGLAGLHQITHVHFGSWDSNYIGSLVQPNQPAATWPLFYAQQRIMPLARLLYNTQAFDKTDVAAAERLCTRLDQIFPEEPPALLHGDLWAGNFMSVQHGGEIMPAVYDPAVYWGHREMDLGMSLLFGGFDSTFYTCYNEHLPLQAGWRQRVPFTQLYPLLVHAVLFGGGYIGNCQQILSAFR